MATFFIAILSVEARVITTTPMSQKGDQAYATLPHLWKRQALGQLCDSRYVQYISEVLNSSDCISKSGRNRLGSLGQPFLCPTDQSISHINFKPKPQFQIPMGDRVHSTSDFGSSQRSSQIATLCHRLTLTRPSRPFAHYRHALRSGWGVEISPRFVLDRRCLQSTLVAPAGGST